MLLVGRRPHRQRPIIDCRMQAEDIQAMIQQGLPDAEVQVSGDGRHFDAVVVSEAFAGKGLLEQHRLVYATLARAVPIQLEIADSPSPAASHSPS